MSNTKVRNEKNIIILNLKHNNLHNKVHYNMRYILQLFIYYDVCNDMHQCMFRKTHLST